MPREPLNEPMSTEAMIAMQQEKTGTKFYKAESDEHRREELAQLTERIGRELHAAKIPLVNGDLEQVKRQVDAYFSACTRTGTLVTMTGLSRSLGHSRANLYKFLDTHSQTPIAEYLALVQDAVEDSLDCAGLANAINPTFAMFLLKSVHRRVDRSELFLKTEPPPDPMGELTSREELMAKYRAAIPEVAD